MAILSRFLKSAAFNILKELIYSVFENWLVAPSSGQLRNLYQNYFKSISLAILSNYLMSPAFNILKEMISSVFPLEKLSSLKEVSLQRNISFEEDSWDKLYNETGDLLRPDALEEVSKLFYIICLFEAVILFIYFPEL